MISFVVYPETKTEWQEAVESNEYPNIDSLSQLARIAINQYLHDQSSGSGAEVSQEVHEQLTELNTQQEGINQRLDEIKGQLSDVRETVVGSEISSETEELAQDIFNILPTKQEVQSDPVLSGDYETQGVPAPREGSVEWLSDQLGAPRYKVQTAIEYLQENTYVVQQTDESGQYYKEGEK